MSNVPAVLGALIADGLSAIGLPGGSTAGDAVKGYLQRRSDTARDILLDEFHRGHVDAVAVAADDDRVAVIYRFLRASWEGSARVNLRLLAKAIVGRLRTGNLVADEFLPHADALAALSRDEIILIAAIYEMQRRFETAEEFAQHWPDLTKAMEGKGWSKEHIQATAARAQRSGYVLAGTAWDEPSYRLSPMFINLAKTVDFADALRHEAKSNSAAL